MLDNAYAISTEAGDAMFEALQGSLNAVQFDPQVEYVEETLRSSGNSMVHGNLHFSNSGLINGGGDINTN